MKERYRHDPAAALVTLRATGTLGAGITCSVGTGRALVEAGLHPSTGGDGLSLCSGDMLLEALVACAGVTLGAVATSLGDRDCSPASCGQKETSTSAARSRSAGRRPVGFSAIRLAFELETGASEEQLDTLLRLTERYCVVYQTLVTGPVPLDLLGDDFDLTVAALRVSLCESERMLLYNSAVSGNCYKVRLLAAHLGVPLELHELSVVDRSNRADVIGNLNPARRVPTLVLDDGRPLAESNAILWYFGEGTEYVPADRYERAQVLQWQFFEQYQHEPSIAVVRFLLCYSGVGREAHRSDQGADGERVRRARRDGATSRHAEHSSSVSATRWRTSRCTPTPMSRTKAASTSGRTPRSAPGSTSRRPAGPHHDRRVSSGVRVRFAPSPTGSLHLGNALSAVANRAFADEHGGVLVLRVDDTDPDALSRAARRRFWAIWAGSGSAWEEGPIRQSERADRHAEAAALALDAGAIRDPDGSIRLAGTTLARADGSPTYQLATVVDDLDLGITHIIRGSDHRPNEEVQQRIARALGGELPEVIHHGLLLGDDGKKLSKRAEHSSVADLRDEGVPAAAVRAYLDELGLPRHDVNLDVSRIQRLAIDAIASMSDEDLAAAADAPLELARALRGARTLVEAREIARQILEPDAVALGDDAAPTLDRFAELRVPAADALDEPDARAIVRELKAVGGNLKFLRLALTGAERGPELWTVVAAVPRDEALRRAAAAITAR